MILTPQIAAATNYEEALAAYRAAGYISPWAEQAAAARFPE